MEKTYQFNRQEIADKIEAIVGNVGPFVRKVNDMEELFNTNNHSELDREMDKFVALRKEIKSGLLENIMDLSLKILEITKEIEESLVNVTRYSNEWREIQTDLSIAKEYFGKIEATREIVLKNLSTSDMIICTEISNKLTEAI